MLGASDNKIVSTKLGWLSLCRLLIFVLLLFSIDFPLSHSSNNEGMLGVCTYVVSRLIIAILRRSISHVPFDSLIMIDTVHCTELSHQPSSLVL